MDINLNMPDNTTAAAAESKASTSASAEFKFKFFFKPGNGKIKRWRWKKCPNPNPDPNISGRDKYIAPKFQMHVAASFFRFLGKIMEEKQRAILFKQMGYSKIWLDRSAAIANGEAETLVKIKKAEGSVLMFWKLSDKAVATLANRISHFGLDLAQVSVKKGDPVEFLMALSVSSTAQENNVSEMADRYEYSVFVQEKGCDQPYYMTLEVGSSTDTLDPVNGIVRATSAVHLDIHHLDIQEKKMCKIEAKGVKAHISPGTRSVELDWKFLSASSRRYWTNGVVDFVYFNTASLLHRPTICTVNMQSGSFMWDGLVLNDGPPILTIVCNNQTDRVVSPWRGLAKHNPSMLSLKSSYYSKLAHAASESIKGGEDALIDVVIAGKDKAPSGKAHKIPRVLVNFEVLPESVPEFVKFLNLVDGMSLARMKITAKSPKMFAVSLCILSEESFSTRPWNKAVWATYIQDKDGNIFLHEFHFSVSEMVHPTVTHLFSRPAKFSVIKDANAINVTVQDKVTKWTIKYPRFGQSGSAVTEVAKEWVLSHSRVYWEKGVYDELYVSDELTRAQVTEIDVSQVSLIQKSPWKGWLSAPVEAYGFLNDVTFVDSVWKNITTYKE